MTIRESPDELARAEEVNTWKALIDVKQIKLERWSPLLVDADWHAFCQALCIEGEDWEEMCDSYKEMSKALVVEKPQGPEGKSLVGHEASQRLEERVF